MKNNPAYVLLFTCKDQRGIIAKISDFIYKKGGNIIISDQYTTDPAGGDFFMRIEFVIGKPADLESLRKGFLDLAKSFSGSFNLFDKNKKITMGILVSKPDHCLLELLYLWRTGCLHVDIPFVISNYREHEAAVRQYNLPFHFIPATKSERKNKEILAIAKSADFLVLARYMLVFSGEFLKAYGKDIINIHHGFLPSFKGGNPYKQALDKGVKVIGATAHFVTEELDNGPIIAQEVEYVSHKDDLSSLMQKGRHLENRALSDAIHSYIDYRIIRHNNKTIVF